MIGGGLSLAVACSLFTAAPGVVARPKVVAVVLPGDPLVEAQAAQLELLAGGSLQRSGRFEWLRLLEALDPKAAAARSKRREEAQVAMSAGLKAYNDLDTARAFSLFDKAMKGLWEADLSQDFGRYLQAWAMRAAAQFANGESKAALREMERMLAVAPKTKFSPNFFSPDALAAAERFRQKLSHSGKLEVKTAPVAARIYVDGEFQGDAPFSMTGLTAEEHVVTALAPGYRLWQERVREGPLSIALQPAERGAEYASTVRRMTGLPPGPEKDRAACDLGARLGAEQVLLIVARKSSAGERIQVAMVRLDAREGRALGEASGSLPLRGLGQEAWDALVDPVLAGDSLRARGPTRSVEAEAKAGTGSKPIGYGLLAAGAALLGAGAFTGFEALSANREFRAMPQTNPAAQSVQSRGQTYALLTDVFVLAGLASSAAGGYFGWFSGEAPADRTPSAKAKPTPPPTASVESPQVNLQGPPPEDVGGSLAPTNPPAQEVAQPPATAHPAPRRGAKRLSEDEDLRNF